MAYQHVTDKDPRRRVDLLVLLALENKDMGDQTTTRAKEKRH